MTRLGVITAFAWVLPGVLDIDNTVVPLGVPVILMISHPAGTPRKTDLTRLRIRGQQGIVPQPTYLAFVDGVTGDISLSEVFNRPQQQ
jgi:hypothetical protein